MDAPALKTACSETLILRLLSERPMHGYELSKEVERRSRGYFVFKHGTLYPVLHRLERRGLIAGDWSATEGGRPRKSYRLTRKGRREQGRNAAAWRELFAAMSALVPEVAP